MLGFRINVAKRRTVETQMLLLRVFVVLSAGLAVIPMAIGLDVLPSPQERVRVAREFTEQPIPKWQNGHFLALERYTPTVLIFGPNGAKIREVTVRIPDAGRVDLLDAAIARDGRIAVTGGAVSSAGAGFIALIASFCRKTIDNKIVT